MPKVCNMPVYRSLNITILRFCTNIIDLNEMFCLIELQKDVLGKK